MYDIFLEAVVLVLQCLLVVCVLSYSNAVCGPTMRPRPNGPHVSMSVDNALGFRHMGLGSLVKGARLVKKQTFERRASTLNHARSKHSDQLCLKAEVLTESVTTTNSLGGDESTENREKLFEKWAANAGVKAPKLEHSFFPDELMGEVRGLRAVKETSASEQLVSIPVKATVTLRASESSPFKSWVSREFWDSQKWYVKLAMKLLWERQIGASSGLEGYWRVLPSPESFDTLIHWDDRELDMLHYSRVAASAKRQREAWDKLHKNLVARCPEGAGRAVTKDDLVWAMECVLSRAFRGRFGGGQQSAIVSGAVMVAAVGMYYMSQEPAWVLLAGLALLPLTLQLGLLDSPLISSTAASGDYVLVPFVDSMNHVTSAETELSFNPLSGTLSVSVNRGYEEGEQAYISYGRKSNDELLQFYGFVEADCPADTYVIEDIATKLGLTEARIHAIRDTEARTALNGVVIGRGLGVVSRQTLEGLRMLLETDTTEEDATVWLALRRVLEAELEHVRLDDGEKLGESVRQRLALAFRREKTSVLEEAIRNLHTKEG